MIDLDRIEEWNENDLGEESYEVQAIVSKGDLLDFITRLRQAEKDAARYRFMRDMSDEVDVSRFFHIEVSERDAEIDEAMQCK